MKAVHAVGIDLGTTYSCIAWLNEHGQPVTIPNEEGELSTPSVVFIERGQAVVGTEALRHAIVSPDRVIQYAKRFMGDNSRFWKIDDQRYSPVQVSALVLRKLLKAARNQLGEVREAVITVPAQFSEAQRQATVLAGYEAGLERIEMINEPTAAALCHVLGQEGLAFSALAIDEQLLVFDLGGGTLDLAVIRYQPDEVRVLAVDGELELGGLDWTRTLLDLAAGKFLEDVGIDPRSTPEDLQYLALEAEQAKRSLSLRPRTVISVRSGGTIRSYPIELAEFEQACRPLIERCELVTRRILAENNFGWARINTLLTTGGATRMPMVRDALKRLSGRTLNTSLSPDQSIAHGAAYYAGMLLQDRDRAQTVFKGSTAKRLPAVRVRSVNARALGILIRDELTSERIPHYLLPANTPLPASVTHVFGTVVANQTRVRVRIVESGTAPDRPPVVLGDCEITQLPPNLPEGAEIEVTISYDRQARVHVTAREPLSNRAAEVELVRSENISEEGTRPSPPAAAAPMPPATTASPSPAKTAPVSAAPPAPAAAHPATQRARRDSTPAADAGLDVRDLLEQLSDFSHTSSAAAFSDQPVLLCNTCGKPLGRGGVCPACGPSSQPETRRRPARHTDPKPAARSPRPPKPNPAPTPKKQSQTDANADEFWDIIDG
ncbi:MAG: Hsp70 family protein [Planctomycetota bacterium]